MKSIIAIGLGLSVLAGGAQAQTKSSSYVPYYGSPDRPAPSFVRSAPPAAPRSYATNPSFPAAPKPPTMAQPDMFKPYKPKSVYSERGGLDSYPKPAKPKGYVDLR